MVGGGLWELNLDVCGENDEIRIAVIGVDCAVDVVFGDVCMFSSCTTKVDFLFLVYKILGDGDLVAVVGLTSVDLLVGPADVWDLVGDVGLVVGLVVVCSDVLVGLGAVVWEAVFWVVSVFWVTVVSAAVVLSTEVFSLDGGFLTYLAGIFILFEDPTSSTSCCCSFLRFTNNSALASKVSALFCLA